MHYVCSDIHGEYDRYLAMLKGIDLKPSDTLFILGDVIDRGVEGVSILQDIMTRDNAVLLMGNHELMCLQTLGPVSFLGARDLWKSNGGSPTYRELVYHIGIHERNQILKFLNERPYHLNVEVDGRLFHLVHGFPDPDPGESVWKRPERNTPNPYDDGSTLIIGHTPVPYLMPEEDLIGLALDPANDHGKHLKILHAPGFIDIDCACGNTLAARRLACLRLEDMAEFYF